MSSWRAEHPFNNLAPLPPRSQIETVEVLKAVIEARVELAALDQAAKSMTNPAVLINSIPLLEAQASSEIENIVTTTDELFMASPDGTDANPATREALRYRTALFEGLRLVADRGVITTQTAREICSIIKMHDIDLRAGTGTYIGNPSTQVPTYTPPEGREVIQDKLTNWELFVNSSEGLDPLVRMALAHYQFEAIHPFEDGNGRTGRVLNILILVSSGLLDWPILYLSRYIIATKNEYYDRLLRVTSHEDWSGWVKYVLTGIYETSRSTLKKIAAIQNLQDNVKQALSAIIPRGGHGRLMDVLFEQPYCRIANVMEVCGVSRPTATAWLRELSQHGILVEHKAGREILFVNAGFMQLLMRDEDKNTLAAPPLF